MLLKLKQHLIMLALTMEIQHMNLLRLVILGMNGLMPFSRHHNTCIVNVVLSL